MSRRLQYLTGAIIVAAIVCTERGFRTGGLGWWLAAAAAYVLAVVTAVVAAHLAPAVGVERSAARTTLVFALVVLGAVVLYFVYGLTHLHE